MCELAALNTIESLSFAPSKIKTNKFINRLDKLINKK